MNLQKNKEKIFREVYQAARAAGRQKESVRIIAVTKYVDAFVARGLVHMGVVHIGENRVDQFLEKYQAFKNETVTWHLIGTLQRKKVKDVINYVDYFHALDSLKLAVEIQKRSEHVINCFLQVNISKEESKHGFREEDLDQVLPELSKLSNLKIVGLMTMSPIDANAKDLEEIFRKAQELQKTLQNKQLINMPFTELSLGMSRDFSIAIKYGATYVRIGTAFFE